MVPKSLPNSSVYPKVNYFHNFDDLFSLTNAKFEFINVILSLKTMIDGTFFFEPLPLPHEARNHFVSGCISLILRKKRPNADIMFSEDTDFYSKLFSPNFFSYRVRTC